MSEILVGPELKGSMMKKLVMAATLVFGAGRRLGRRRPDGILQGQFLPDPAGRLRLWAGSIPFGGERRICHLRPLRHRRHGHGPVLERGIWIRELGHGLTAEANYHFVKLTADKLDLYFGLGLGYGIYSVSYGSGYLSGVSGSSGLRLLPILGGRYYISPKVAISLRLIGSTRQRQLRVRGRRSA